MPTAVIDNPILNSPFAEPARHWVLDENGVPTGLPAEGRRRSEFVVPVPPAKHTVRAQGALGLEDEYGQRKPNDAINEVRSRVAAWRALGDAGLRAVTPVTARLLRHWRDPARARRLFFCQIEAVETAIWLTEVAPRSELDRVRTLNAEANPDLLRVAIKLATGAGKTTVMGMLIAWQTLNAARARQSRTFTDAFLVVAPGITIRDRLRVLLPSGPASIYGDKGLDLVPPEMRDDLQRARVVVTNFHAFQRRERACCTERACRRSRPNPIRGQAIRTEIGRPNSNMRLRAQTATSTSVARRSSARERSPSPITCFHRPTAASARARVL